MTTMTDKPLVELAEELGAEAGREAAGWVVDGNTSTETLATLARGIADGDPMVLDGLVPPRLWAAGDAYAYDREDLARDLDVDEVTDAEANAWEAAADEAFQLEVERIVRSALGTVDDGRPYWIVYWRAPGYGLTLERYATLAKVDDDGRAWIKAHWDVTADVYAATDEDAWIEAKRFDGTGVPFDYMDYRIERGPRGGLVRTRA
jgi:hypothetical protein